MNDPITQHLKPAKRTRRPKAEEPPTPKVLEVEFLDETKLPQQNDVIQITAGDHRGVLCQIGDWNGTMYRCYVINPPNPPISISVKPGEFHMVGKAKVASRNPFPVEATPPEPDPHSEAE